MSRGHKVSTGLAGVRIGKGLYKLVLFPLVIPSAYIADRAAMLTANRADAFERALYVLLQQLHTWECCADNAISCSHKTKDSTSCPIRGSEPVRQFPVSSSLCRFSNTRTGP